MYDYGWRKMVALLLLPYAYDYGWRKLVELLLLPCTTVAKLVELLLLPYPFDSPACGFRYEQGWRPTLYRVANSSDVLLANVMGQVMS